MFRAVEPYLGDPIFSLVEAFKADENPNKINLSIGFYYDDEGKVPQLESVKEALDRIYKEYRENPALYLPMQGSEAYHQAVLPLLLGDDPAVEEGRVAVIQSLGGSGALRIGGDFLNRYYPNSTVWVSDPTWANHIDIFTGTGFHVKRYPYFDHEHLTVDFEALLAQVDEMAPFDVMILHPCCHNPTGADLTEAEWDQLLEKLKAHQIIPFFDIAYQGFGRGIEEDIYAIRQAARLELSFLISCSFSKTFSLYGERIGALIVRCDDREVRDNVFGQLRATVRRNYSNPPTLGMLLVTTVLNADGLRTKWMAEVDEMRQRIRKMRELLVAKLDEVLGSSRFNHLLEQSGMFAFTGLLPDQIATLRQRHGVYLLNNGRICISGLTSSNVDYVANAIAETLLNP